MEQHGDTHHSACQEEFFDDNTLQILQWLAKSPDLTPIQSVWHILEQHREKVFPKNKAEL